MNIERRDFDKEATAWDEVPARVKLANDITAAISDEIVLTSNTISEFHGFTRG